jgi:branched-chain amino acid transport system permease protein
MISQDIAANPFSADQSLRVFAIVVIGGMASLPGAILGAVYVYAMQYYMLPEWRFLATGVGLLAILLILPGGLGAGIAEARDAGLRWVAKRRRILVPSLVADRRVGDLEVSPAMAAAVAEAVDRPEVEEVVEVQS